VIVPPVALKFTETGAVLPLLSVPVTLNCCDPPVTSDAVAGLKVTATTAALDTTTFAVSAFPVRVWVATTE